MSTVKRHRLDRRPFDRFAFVVVEASEPTNALTDKTRKDLIRSHARRARSEKVKEKERRGISSDSLEINDLIDRPPPSLSEHISKFRLERPISQKQRTLKARSQKTIESDQWNSLSPKDVSTGTAALPFAGVSPSNNALRIFRDNGLVDPFDSLPISLGPTQRMLLSYYSTNLAKSFIAFDPRKRLMLESSSDPAWLNATFSLLALYHDLQAGRSLSSECLYHRGEALRLVNERLSMSPSQYISRSTVGAVASLVNFDITTGSTANAKIHMSGLQHMVMLHGGLLSFGHNQVLQSLVSWSDLLYSSACDSLPRFSFACNSSSISVTPICIHDHHVYQEQQSQSASFNDKMRETVRILRVLSLKKSAAMLSNHKLDSSESIDQVEFSNCIYLTEYRLLTLFDNAASNHVSRIMRKPWQLGVYLYLHLALRELPGELPVECNLVKRLKTTLEAITNLCELWADNLSLLLWIVFIGAAATTANSVERLYFVQQLMMVKYQVGIASRVDFIRMLKSVMWLETFCGPHAITVWFNLEAEIAKQGIAE